MDVRFPSEDYTEILEGYFDDGALMTPKFGFLNNYLNLHVYV